MLNPEGKIFTALLLEMLMLMVVGNDDKFPTHPDGSRDIIKDWNHVEAWKQMEQVFASGKAKAVGVCNVSQSARNPTPVH